MNIISYFWVKIFDFVSMSWNKSYWKDNFSDYICDAMILKIVKSVKSYRNLGVSMIHWEIYWFSHFSPWKARKLGRLMNKSVKLFLWIQSKHPCQNKSWIQNNFNAFRIGWNHKEIRCPKNTRNISKNSIIIIFIGVGKNVFVFIDVFKKIV